MAYWKGGDLSKSWNSPPAFMSPLPLLSILGLRVLEWLYRQDFGWCDQAENRAV